ALAALGVPRLSAAAVVELLAGLERPPGWWRRCYAALAPLADTDPAAREELGGLPVPLSDGRTVTGPRGVLLGGAELPAVDVPGLRLVHPDAAHPLLERLGARPVGPAELLDALRPAVERSVDDAEDGADVAPLVGAVLGLAARIGDAPARRPWLGALALTDAGGQPRRADELVAPDGALRPLLAPDAPLGVLAPDTYPSEGTRAVGVLDSFAVLDEPEPTGPDHDLADEDTWWAAIGGDASPPPRLLAVRDLDLVDDSAWPAALRLLAADPVTSAAVREPRGYTGWWLARNARLGGYPLRHWRLPGADELAGLYDPVPLDRPAAAFLTAAGVRGALHVEDPEDAADLLARLADPARAVTPAVAHAAHAALVAAELHPADLEPPERVRAVTGAVVDADRALVLDAPWLAAVLPGGELVAGGDPAALADLLDLPLASEAVTAELLDAGGGRPVAWASVVDVVVACAAMRVPVPDGELVLHERLRVRHDGAVRDVRCWVDRDGAVHATDPLRALLACLP
ncbi:MAG: sacsin N-terminal ATP-binding-like domain-containing protein, partial [Pseudonocardiaceae bacterium]